MATNDQELADWLSGTATGGPNGDGRYPITGKDGSVVLVLCPAAEALDPIVESGPLQGLVGTATSAAATASADAANAAASATSAANSAASVESALADVDAKVQTAMQSEVSDRKAALATQKAELQANIDNETHERIAADLALKQELSTSLQSVADQAASAVSAEQDNRVAAIASEVQARQDAIAAEITARVNAVTQETQNRTAAIAAEAQNRVDDFTQERLDRAAAIADEAAARSAAISQASQNAATALANEVANRAAAIDVETTARTNAINAEANARATALLNEQNSRDAAITEERILRQSGDESLSVAISQVSAGTGTQFDPINIWNFDTTPEGWSGNGAPTIEDGWLRPADAAENPYIYSPTGLAVAGESFRFVKLRIRKGGAPVWAGALSWRLQGAAADAWSDPVALSEPAFDEGGNVTISWDDVPWWPETVDQIRLVLSTTQTATDYLMVDWLAIGRPTPGAGVAALRAETVARVAADSAEATQRTTLASQMRGDYTGTDVASLSSGLLYSERQARTTADSAMASDITSLQASTGANAAAITDESTARSDADAALSTRITAVKATADNAATQAALTAEQTARATADSAMAQDLALLGAHTTDKSAFVLDQTTVKVDATTTLAQRIASLDAADANNAAAVSSETTARTNADTALGQRVDTVTATANNAATKAALTSEQTTRANADTALGQRIDTVTATAGSNTAAITAEQQARVTGDSANASSITDLRSSFTASKTDVLSLVPDYLTAKPKEWESHYGVGIDLSPNFITITDGQIGNHAVHNGTGSFWNYSKTVLPLVAGERYRYAALFRASADSTHPCYFTRRYVKADGSFGLDTLGNNYGSNQLAVPKTGKWTLMTVDILADTFLAQGIVGLEMGFALNHPGTAGWAEMQGFRVTKVIQTTDTDASIATSASVTSEASTRATADTALSGRIDSLTATVGQNTAAITTEQTARADADTALSQRVDTVTATANAAATNADLITERTARADADGALGQRVDAIKATADNAATSAALDSEATIRASADSAMARDITLLGAHTADKSAFVLDQTTVKVDAGTTLAQKFAALQAVDAGNAAAITAEQTARTDGDSALGQRIDTINATTGFIFRDTMEGNPATRWSTIVSVSSPGEVVSAVGTDTLMGGNVLRVGNNSGNDQVWLQADKQIPFDESKLYRIRARARRVAGDGTLYLGLVGYAADGVTRIDYAGGPGTSFFYCVAVAQSPALGEWVEYIGYVKGVSDSTPAIASSDYKNPTKVRTGVQYVRPGFIANYSGKAGIAELDYFIIEDADALGAALTAQAQVVSEATARTTSDTALGQRIDAVNVTVGNNTAAVATEVTARTNADNALGQRIDTMNVKVGDNTSAITAEQSARSDADSALSTRIDTVTATANNAATAAALTSEQTTRANADTALGQRIDTTNANVADNAAAITAETNARASADSVEANQRTTLATQMRGGYEGSDLSQLTSGLLFQEKSARSNQYESVVQQMTLLQAGVGEQFDYAKIWYFTSGTEGWSGGAQTDGTWLKQTTPYVTSPRGLNVNGAEYTQFRIRIRKTGAPVWSGLVGLYEVGHTGSDYTMFLPPEPEWDSDGIAVLTINFTMPKTIDGIILRGNAVVPTATDFYEFDWVAIGRPAPGASSSALADEATARASADQAETTARQTLSTKLVGAADPTGKTLANITNGLIFDERQARSTADTAEVTARQSLSATLTGLPDPTGKSLAQLTSGLVYEERTARATADTAMAQNISTLQGQVGDNTAAISSEATARATGDTALGTRIDSVTATANAAATKAALTSEQTARADADSALGKRLDVVQATTGYIFRDVFSDLNQWPTGGRPEVVSAPSDEAKMGGSTTLVGNNSGNDTYIAYNNLRIPFDPSKLYKMRFRVRVNAGAGKVYAGVRTLKADGTTPSATNNGNQYFLAGGGTPTAFTEYTCYVKGLNGADSPNGTGTLANPFQLPVDSKYIAPLMLLNYGNVSGITEVDYFLIEDADALGEALTAQASVVAETTARTTADTALGQRIDAINATVGQNTSAITAEQTARADADSANATQINSVSSTVNAEIAKNSAIDSRNDNQPPSYYWANYPRRTITEFKYCSVMTGLPTNHGNYCYVTTTVRYPDPSGGPIVQRATLDDGSTYTRQSAGTTAWSVWVLTASVPFVNAQVTSEATTRANADSALGQRIDTVEATADNAATSAQLTTEQTARADADTALGTRIDSVTATANNAATQASLVSEQQARADADTALGQRIDTVTATVGSNTAAITAEQTARADGDSANAAAITSVQASLDGLTNLVKKADFSDGSVGGWAPATVGTPPASGWGSQPATQYQGKYLSAPANNWSVEADNTFDVVPGDVYDVSANVFGSSLAGVAFGIQFINSAGGQAGVGAIATNTVGTWAPVAGSVTVPAGAVTGRPVLSGPDGTYKYVTQPRIALASKGTASAVQQLTAGTTIGGTAYAAATTMVDANGHIGGTRLASDGSTSNFTVSANRFAIVDPDNVTNLLSYSNGNLVVSGTVQSSLLRSSAMEIGSTRIYTGGDRLAPFVIKDVSTVNGGTSYTSRTLVLSDFIGPGYGSGYNWKRFAAQRMDVFLEAIASCDGPAGANETIYLQAQYNGGTWEDITNVTSVAEYKSVIPLCVRYTTADTWNTLAFRAYTSQGHTIGLTFKVEVLNFNMSGSAAKSTSGVSGGTTPPPTNPPNPPYCVDWETTVLPDGRYVRDLQKGDMVEVVDIATGERYLAPLLGMDTGYEDCYYVTTLHGGIIQSKSTPMDMRDGTVMRTPDLGGRELLTHAHGWEEAEVFFLGERKVCRPDFGDKMFFAGVDAGMTIATHNAMVKNQPI